MTVQVKASADNTYGTLQVGGVDAIKFGAGAAGDPLEVAKKPDISSTITTAFSGSNTSLTSNGYQKLPSGVILQWCRISIGAFTDSSTASGSWPTAFPNACWGMQATPSTIVAIVREGSVSTTGFSIGLNARDGAGAVAAGTCVIWGVGN